MTTLKRPAAWKLAASAAFLIAAGLPIGAQADIAKPVRVAETQLPADTSIRPFHFRASDEALADLRRRISATKWPSQELVGDDTQGGQLETMRKLAQYWSTDYDWRRVEARLESLPQFVTNIDGVDIHFIHVRSRHRNALPIIVTHGWPGSIVEQLKIIDPLTNPTAHGGTDADAFDIVIPSLPGYGFSGKPTELGWEPARIARAWTELMKRLGYTSYVAQGGDWGRCNRTNGRAGTEGPAGDTHQYARCRSGRYPEVAGCEPAGTRRTIRGGKARLWAAGFLLQTRPCLRAGNDGPSPDALWRGGFPNWPRLVDARSRRKSYQLIARVFDGQEEGLTRDDVLDNITLYWLTNTAVSSARLYWENKFAFFAPKGIKIPVAVSAFPDELYQAPESWAKQAFPSLIYYNRPAKGGHFAAWEQPQLFSEELRAAFKGLR